MEAFVWEEYGGLSVPKMEFERKARFKDVKWRVEVAEKTIAKLNSLKEALEKAEKLGVEVKVQKVSFRADYIFKVYVGWDVIDLEIPVNYEEGENITDWRALINIAMEELRKVYSAYISYIEEAKKLGAVVIYPEPEEEDDC